MSLKNYVCFFSKSFELYSTFHVTVCSLRRREVLEALPSNDVLGVHIPQCAPLDHRYYRPRQCRGGTELCFCVNSFGKKTRAVARPDSDCSEKRRSDTKSGRAIRAELAELAAIGCATAAKKNGHCPPSVASTVDAVSKAHLACMCDEECTQAKKCCRFKLTKSAYRN